MKFVEKNTEAEFKEFELWLKFKPGRGSNMVGFMHFKSYSLIQDLSRHRLYRLKFLISIYKVVIYDLSVFMSDHNLRNPLADLPQIFNWGTREGKITKIVK